MRTDAELAKAFTEEWLEVAGDSEMAHVRADDFILNVLREAGYPELIEAYNIASADFWYA